MAHKQARAGEQRRQTIRLHRAVLLAQAGDAAAMDLLLARMAPLCWWAARQWAIRGLTLDDVVQECRLAVADAVIRWDGHRGASFVTLATLAVRKRLVTLLNASQTQRRQLVELTGELGHEDAHDRPGDQRPYIEPAVESVEDTYLRREVALGLIRDALAGRTPWQRRVVELLAEGLTYEEAAAELGTSPKAVSNARQRVWERLQHVSLHRGGS